MSVFLIPILLNYRNFLGTPSPDGSCKFTYRSSSRKDGRFNSPRHPSNYPSNTDCYYEFYAMPHEQVQIVFDNFKVRTDNLKQDQSLGNAEVSQCENSRLFSLRKLPQFLKMKKSWPPKLSDWPFLRV